jgi:hypothetical protein
MSGPYVDMADTFKHQEDVYQLEEIDTTSRGPETAHYRESDGLRTEGDGLDHSQYNSVRLHASNPQLFNAVY